MAKEAKIITEHLARAKAAYQKGSTIRPILSVIEAVKLVATSKLHSMDRGRIDTLMRENVANLNKIPEVKRFAPAALAYQKGKEKQLFAQLVPIVKKIKEERDRESLEAMRERKYKIDRLLITGKKYLEHKKISDAQESFREAVGLYEDENAMFLMIAESLIEAGFPRESMEYLRRSLDIDPDDRRACDAVYRAYGAMKDLDGCEDFFTKYIDKQGDRPYLRFGRAQCRFKLAKYKESLADAKAALAGNSEMTEAQKLIRRIAAKVKKEKAKG